MKLVEFTAYWPGDWSKEEIDTYEIMHGEDRNKWPPTNTETPVTIDIERVIRFNPGSNENRITVDFNGGASITLAVSYSDFKTILKAFGIEIYKSCLTQ